MAKGTQGPEDRAKVKLRVIEFELEGGNAAVENSIRQLTQALSARNGAPAKVISSGKQPKELAGGTVEEEPTEAEVVDDDEVDVDEAPATPAARKSRQRSKPKAPEYVHDLMDGAKLEEFKEFAKQKNPTTRPQRYLVATYWLKECGGSPTVTADKMYTCFKNAGWPTNFNDWRGAFDSLVYVEDFRKVGVGEFAINPTGENKVK